MNLSWMGWTVPTAIFFIVIAIIIFIMIIWSIKSPQAPRAGILRFKTTPGDRLFVSLLGSAFICLSWLALYGAPLWGGLAVSFIYSTAVFRWV